MIGKTKAVALIALCGAALALAAIVLSNLIKAPPTTASNTCSNNLRIIDSCKQQWAINNSRSTNDVLSWQDLGPYAPAGWSNRGPVCPSGGTYTIERIGELPKCSIGGASHSLQ